MNAIQTAVSDGTLSVLSVGLAYFKQSDIQVLRTDKTLPLVAGTDYQWTSATSIQLLTSVPVASGVTVTLRRSTANNALLNIYDGGAPFTRTTLDENFLQLLRLSQEFSEGLGLTGLRQSLNMHGYNIESLGTAVFDTDAVNLGLLNAGLGKTLRTPELIAQLPAAAARAGRLLGFDASGAPTLAAPATGSAADLALNLAATGAGKGANLVGYNGGTVQGALDITGVVFDSVASLRTYTALTRQSARTLGYYAKGDGGHATYYADSSDTTSVDNGGTVIVGSDGTRWKLVGFETLNARQFGAKGDGTTSDVAAFTRINNANPAGITLTPGVYLIDSSFTLNVPVRKQPGARFLVPSVTLTLAEVFDSPVSYAFQCTGTGKVVFAPSKNSFGYPEWWGATTNLSVDATAAIQACHVALPLTQLQAADYTVASTLVVATPGHGIKGRGCNWYANVSDSTRIISQSGSAHVVQMGPSAQPSSINSFPQGLYLEDVLVTRGVAPVIASGCAGVLSRWTLYQTMKNVKVAENINGYWYQGTVQARTLDCQAFRSIAGTGTGTDICRGFYIDGTTVLSGVAGGNASVHWDRCVAGCVLAGVTSIGMDISGSWADTFVENFEASVCSIGIQCAGDTTATLNYRTVDLHIINPIIDQFSFAGIYVNGTSPFGTISVVGGYAAPVGTGTPTACVYVLNSQGSVDISGGFQYICGPNPSMTAGLLIYSSGNVTAIGNTHIECATSAVILQGAKNCRIMDRTKNHSRIGQSGVKVLGTSSANYIAPMCAGAANGLVVGVDFADGSNVRNETNVSGVDSTICSSGKARVAGTVLTTGGTTGSNLFSGNFA